MQLSKLWYVGMKLETMLNGLSHKGIIFMLMRGESLTLLHPSEPSNQCG